MGVPSEEAVARLRKTLAELYVKQERLEEAEEILRSCVEIMQSSFGEGESYGFFRGISGLGYTLLRLRTTSQTRRLPSVLAFETMEPTREHTP